MPERSTEVAKVKSTPTNADLATSIAKAHKEVAEALKQLQPLRAGAPIVTEEELKMMEQEWKKYRVEWITRKKLFRE